MSFTILFEVDTRKQQLVVPSAFAAVNLFRHNQESAEEIKKPQRLPSNPASGRLWQSKTSYVRQRYTKIEYQQG